MRSLRVAVSVGATLFLAAGYMASVVAFMNGTASVHAARMDAPGIRMLSAAILLLCLALSLVPDREGEKS